jgi:hypothetical protein
VKISPSRHRHLTPLLVGAIALAVYLATMPPDLTWDLGGVDGGELATAVYTRGLVHSPGYPTYLLLAQPATLLPVKSPAHRLNIFSAIGAAAAAALLAWATAQAIDKNASPSWGASLAGVLAGLVFALGELVWSQAVITEVYALASLFCVALLALALWVERAESEAHFRQRLALLGLIAGLGVGSHYFTLFMALFAAIYLLLHARERLLRSANLLALVGFALGLGVFIYLPLRAGKAPISNWGDPRTLDRFVWVVRGAAYAERFHLGLPFGQLAALVRVLVAQLSIVGVGLAALGLSEWWDADRRLLVGTLIVVVLDLWLTASYASADTLPYIYPTLILLAMAAGSAAHLIVFTWLPDQIRIRGPVYIGLAIAICAPLVARNLATISRATTEAEEYGRQVVENAPPGSLILSNQETHTFAIRYAAAVEVGRADVVPVDVRLLQFDWFRADLARFYPQLGLDEEAVAARENFRALELVMFIPPDVPVVFTYPAELPSGYRLAADQDRLTYVLVERPPVTFLPPD